MTTHLVIPDSHVMPGDRYDRFRWLSKLIIDLKPEVIVNIGDMADMGSLCSYDKGTRGYEGRRYSSDIECVREANDVLFSEVDKYNTTQRRNKKPLYRPYTVFCIGNHEYRIQRAIDCQAILENTIGIKDLGYDRHYQSVVDYLESEEIDGIMYSHCLQNENSPTIIGGEHHAHSLLVKKHCSVTVGHSHKLDYRIHTTGTGSKIMGLVAGCYFDFPLEWAKTSNLAWWRGVCICRNVQDGQYDLETIEIDNIRRKYGSARSK